MTTALLAYAVLAHALVAAGAVVRRVARRDPLRPDRDRVADAQALAATDRSAS